MARGLLIVESHPASPEQAAAYHDWYGTLSRPEGVQLSPLPVVRYFRQISPNQ
jgi:hypothetical protein